MPKQKSRRAIRRRFRFTATGKVKRSRANRRHLLSHRSVKRKRRLRRPATVHWTQVGAVGRMLP